MKNPEEDNSVTEIYFQVTPPGALLPCHVGESLHHLLRQCTCMPPLPSCALIPLLLLVTASPLLSPVRETRGGDGSAHACWLENRKSLCVLERGCVPGVKSFWVNQTSTKLESKAYVS